MLYLLYWPVVAIQHHCKLQDKLFRRRLIPPESHLIQYRQCSCVLLPVNLINGALHLKPYIFGSCSIFFCNLLENFLKVFHLCILRPSLFEQCVYDLQHAHFFFVRQILDSGRKFRCNAYCCMVYNINQ